MREKRVFFSFLLVFSLLVLTLAAAAKAEYPEKPIEFVLHSAPGGGMDVITRTVAHILESEGIVKQKIQVNNRRGGAATVAINYVASKKGDPYVLQHWTTSPLVTILRGTTTIKSWEEMTVIANLIEDPNIAFALTDFPYDDMKSLVAYVKTHPKEISACIHSIGGSEHMIAHRIEKSAGVQFNITSFPVCMTAVLGGHVSFGFGTVGETFGQLEAGKIKTLAAVTENRISYLPDLSTIREQGIDTSFTQYRGFWGPPDFPDYALKFWEDAFAKLMKTKAMNDFLRKINAESSYMGSEECKKFLSKYYPGLAQDVKELEAYKKQ